MCAKVARFRDNWVALFGSIVGLGAIWHDHLAGRLFLELLKCAHRYCPCCTYISTQGMLRSALAEQDKEKEQLLARAQFTGICWPSSRVVIIVQTEE